jgi:hypothetical protein
MNNIFKPKENKQENNQEFEAVSKEFQALLDKYKLGINISIEFPEYKVLPADVQLALQVMSKHTNKFVMKFVKREELTDGNKK